VFARSSELSIGESFYIPLFYKDYKIDPNDLEDGLFMSPVLLKVNLLFVDWLS
jgi:hypothetical protein